MQQQNMSFYDQHKEQMQQIYRGKYLVIKDNKMFGECNSWQKAGWKALAIFGEDSFLVKYSA